MKDIKDEGGKRAEKMGVKMGKDGSLFLPIRIEAGNATALNWCPSTFSSRRSWR